MSLKVGNNFGNNYNYYGNNVPESSSLNVNPQNSQTPKIPQIPKEVTFTALGCDTEQKLARAAFMAAAAKAGITDVSAQARFADQMLAGNPANLELNGKIELDDAKVRSRLLNRSVNFTLSANEKAALREFRQQYIADGGKIRSNQTPTVDLRETAPNYGVTAPTTASTNSKFRVLLNNNGKPITEQRILAQFAEDQYKGGNLWGQNYLQIAEMSVDQGVKPKIININRIGNKIAVEFEISPMDRAKIHENYKIVQVEVNRAEEIYRNFANNNEISSFLRGVFNGALKSLKGTLDLILDLPGTLKALWQVVTNPVETFNGLMDELSQTWEEFKNAPPNKKAEMLGELVGQAVVEILIGKGIGKAGGILAKTKTGAKLLDEANNLKKLGALKIAEMFSDDAANLARQRVRNKLATQLYSGIPLDAMADLAIIAGNKIKNGTVKFAEFAKQMVDDFGEKVKPHLEKLYREQMAKFNLTDQIDELELKNTNINKLSKPGVYTEKIKWGIQEIEVRIDGKGFWGKRTPQNNPRVDAFERKINPNNESYYIKHPNGGYIQFENIQQTALQDGKLIMQTNNSIYRVYDKPEFLRKKILDEATRQVEGAKYNGLQVEWLVSDKETVNQLTKFFKEKGIDITVKYLPE